MTTGEAYEGDCSVCHHRRCQEGNVTDNYPFSDYPFMGTFHCLYCPLRFQQLTELVAHYEEVHVPAALAEARLKSMRKEGTMWR